MDVPGSSQDMIAIGSVEFLFDQGSRSDVPIDHFALKSFSLTAKVRTKKTIQIWS
jgi:hypothetical protein